MKVEEIYIQNACLPTSHRTVIFTKYLLFFFSVALIVSYIFEKSKTGITRDKIFFSLLLNGCGLWSSTFRKQKIATYLYINYQLDALTIIYS
jgi:hypothetical protein